MRRISCKLLPMAISGLLAISLSACGPGTSSSKEAPVEIHGELINPAPADGAATKPIVSAATSSPSAAIQGSQEAKATTPPVESKPIAPPPFVASTAPAAIPAAPPEPPVIPAQTAKANGWLDVGWDKLASYNFVIPEDGPLTNVTASTDPANGQIPSVVRSLDGRHVSLKGFMLPLKVQDGAVTEFLILKDQSMCCYGSVPKITEWVSAKTTGSGVKPVMDQTVTFEGTLHVGAARENGYLVGIYQMDADKMLNTTGN